MFIRNFWYLKIQRCVAFCSRASFGNLKAEISKRFGSLPQAFVYVQKPRRPFLNPPKGPMQCWTIIILKNPDAIQIRLARDWVSRGQEFIQSGEKKWRREDYFAM
jgi:hypothetical protein